MNDKTYLICVFKSVKNNLSIKELISFLISRHKYPSVSGKDKIWNQPWEQGEHNISIFRKFYVFFSSQQQDSGHTVILHAVYRCARLQFCPPLRIIIFPSREATTTRGTWTPWSDRFEKYNIIMLSKTTRTARKYIYNTYELWQVVKYFYGIGSPQLYIINYFTLKRFAKKMFTIIFSYGCIIEMYLVEPFKDTLVRTASRYCCAFKCARCIPTMGI